MTKEKQNLFAITYHDNKNVKHMTFTKEFKSIRALENQYGKMTIKSLIDTTPFLRQNRV